MNGLFPPPRSVVADVIRRSLDEDLGVAGDLSTVTTIGPDVHGHGRIVARWGGRIAGLDVAAQVFEALGDRVAVVAHAADGDAVEAGATLAELSGNARDLLTGERTALNLLGHLSGIASATAAVVDAVSGFDVRITDTRKTTPGLRGLEKYAVRCGRGSNHRFGLHDAVMLKDNHIAAAGSITVAVEAVRAHVGHTVTIEVEVDRLDQLPEALAAGVDIVLLDNMDPATLEQAVAMVDGRAITEASGGITMATVRQVAQSGVDVISLGWITHSAPRLDVALDLDDHGRRQGPP